MNIFIVVIVLLILSYIIYLSMAQIILDKQLTRIGPDTMPLSSPTQVITSDELKKMWTSNDGSTLVFFINPMINDRTSQNGNEYAKVVQIGSKLNFKILVAPDAGRGLLLAPAQLEIYTKPAGTSTGRAEIVDIPNFPLQRWTTVVIVKHGRRFNVYLNGALSVSYTCLAMPEFDITAPLLIGDSRLGGTISLMSISPNALHPNEIRNIVSTAVDTSGIPYSPITINSLLSNFIPSLPSLPQGFWCPGGNCNTPSMPGSLKQWSSLYA